MARRFQPVVRRARFEVPGYSADEMLQIGNDVTASIRQRIQRASDIYDQPAPQLRPNYAKFKGRRYPPAIRNWTLTGRTIRSMKVLSASPNKVKIGFTDSEANKRAAINNRRVRQFGVSPSDKRELINSLETVGRPVRAVAS